MGIPTKILFPLMPALVGIALLCFFRGEYRSTALQAKKPMWRTCTTSITAVPSSTGYLFLTLEEQQPPQSFDDMTQDKPLSKGPEQENSCPKTTLAGANLQGADLKGVSLVWTNLSQVNLSQANLAGANLSWSNLYKALLKEATLVGADLQGANLEGANFQLANLKNANLRGANLLWTNFAGAHLNGANLQNTYLTWVNMLQAEYDHKTQFPEGFHPGEHGMILVTE